MYEWICREIVDSDSDSALLARFANKRGIGLRSLSSLFTPPQNRSRFRASSELGPVFWFHTAKEPAPAPKNRFNSSPTFELG